MSILDDRNNLMRPTSVLTEANIIKLAAEIEKLRAFNVEVLSNLDNLLDEILGLKSKFEKLAKRVKVLETNLIK